MGKTYTVTLTSSEMLTLRAALSVYKTDRLEQVTEAKDANDMTAAVYFDNQRDRADRLYSKVYYQHEDQCAT